MWGNLLSYNIFIFYKRRTSNAAALKLLDKMLRNYDRRSTPTNDMGKFFSYGAKLPPIFCMVHTLLVRRNKSYQICPMIWSVLIYLRNVYFIFLGIATNVSVELHVASLGSINTENMVIRYYNFEAWEAHLYRLSNMHK